jgi:hypothetical protein
MAGDALPEAVAVFSTMGAVTTTRRTCMKYDKLMLFILGLGIGIAAWIVMGGFLNISAGEPRYQVSTFSSASESATGTRGWWGYVIIDTRSGEVVTEKLNHKGYQ